MIDHPKTEISLSDLPELRRKTELVAKMLTEQLANHLETLRPVFAPERILGKYAGGKTDVHGADLALAELQQKYRPFAARPYELPATFEANCLPLVGSVLDARPWEYTTTVEGRVITMTSPVKWVLSARSSIGLSQLRSIITGREHARLDEVRQTVVNALVLQQQLQRHPGIVTLFRDLRFELATETVAQFPNLPVTTVTSCVQSFRPPDDLLLAATTFSGVPSFIELTDLAAISQPRDLLREKLAAVLT